MTPWISYKSILLLLLLRKFQGNMGQPTSHISFSRALQCYFFRACSTKKYPQCVFLVPIILIGGPPTPVTQPLSCPLPICFLQYFDLPFSTYLMDSSIYCMQYSFFFFLIKNLEISTELFIISKKLRMCLLAGKVLRKRNIKEIGFHIFNESLILEI